MCHLVVVEVAGGGEPLSADAALVRLLTAVDPTVRVQRRRRRKTLKEIRHDQYRVTVWSWTRFC